MKQLSYLECLPKLFVVGESLGLLMPSRRSKGKTRYYASNDLLGKQEQTADLTVGYARVSSHDQKKDLETQATLLSTTALLAGNTRLSRIWDRE